VERRALCQYDYKWYLRVIRSADVCVRPVLKFYLLLWMRGEVAIAPVQAQWNGVQVQFLSYAVRV
jgi:hypothetical protein